MVGGGLIIVVVVVGGVLKAYMAVHLVLLMNVACVLHISLCTCPSWLMGCLPCRPMPMVVSWGPLQSIFFAVWLCLPYISVYAWWQLGFGFL